MKDRPALMEFEPDKVPHIIIEVNQACNITCRACYKNKYAYQKSLDGIKTDIDLAMSFRKLDCVTFAGGEPTLNPELVNAISYVKSKGLTPIILSNGLSLTPGMLAGYRKAGLYIVVVHVDSMQNRPDFKKEKGRTMERDMDGLRDGIFGVIQGSKLLGALSITLYRSTLDQLGDILNYVFSRPNVKGLLATLYQNFHSLHRDYVKSGGKKAKDPHLTTQMTAEFCHPGPGPGSEELKKESVSSSEVEEFLLEEYGLRPDFYIPSNDGRERNWLVCLVLVITAGNGSFRILKLSRGLKAVIGFLLKIQAKVFKRHNFIVRANPAACVMICLLSALTSLNPRYFFSSLGFLFSLFRKGSAIRLKDVVFQQAPKLNKNGDLVYCKSCPDATIRNGKLVPTCIADFVEDQARS